MTSSKRQLAGKTGELSSSPDSAVVSPLLCVDTFQFMVQATMVLSPIRHLELRHVLQLALTIELLRVTTAFVSNSEAFLEASQKLLQGQIRHAHAEAAEREQLYGVHQIVSWVNTQLRQNDDGEKVRGLPQTMSPETAGTLFKLYKVYSLAFLRKATIFFHVAHGVDFPTTAGSEAGLPELERLCHLLHLPDISDILISFSDYSTSSTLKSRAALWLSDCIRCEMKEFPKEQHAASHPGLLGIKLLHPAPLELIGLPQYFDVLMEVSQTRKCPTTGKEVSDPVLCLFCGEIFCSQTVCCLSNDLRGGCNKHVEKCSGPIGMFLFIRKCHVALLHAAKDPRTVDIVLDTMGLIPEATTFSTLSNGSFFSAPYLTKHGETDSGLRSKHQLILNQKRYDKLLRDTWLMTNGSVWSTIARKLESEVNAGGWETL